MVHLYQMLRVSGYAQRFLHILNKMRHKPDYNIEFAHIYADEEFGEEQLKSIVILKEVIQRLKDENKSFITSVLIDEYNPTILRLDEASLIKEIQGCGIFPDFIAYESQLVGVADQLIQEIPQELLKMEYFRKRDKHVVMLHNGSKHIALKVKFESMQRHTCATLSAAWTLCRLGVYQIPENAKHPLTPPTTFDAERLMTILPNKYKSVEDKVMEIIKATEYKDLLEKVEYRFFNKVSTTMVNQLITVG